MEVWGHWDLYFLETESPFSFLRVPTLLKKLELLGEPALRLHMKEECLHRPLALQA